MDVITSKEQYSDIEEDSLCLAIQRTFGESTMNKNKNEIQITSKSFGKIGKIFILFFNNIIMLDIGTIII